ncbi:UNKNOWN [Stylonychia lemnae]|uniref:Uncharacterized protein n=1 Tax=Stylonychia lemnae TaxID=5949 RepID=A0A078ADX1_STYLE|nr:UNKNOWN [Stylonychia lemnae]|eukprot:CDW80409.1 UNKNOWN [Stylonychia lemnae]
MFSVAGDFNGIDSKLDLWSKMTEDLEHNYLQYNNQLRQQQFQQQQEYNQIQIKNEETVSQTFDQSNKLNELKPISTPSFTLPQALKLNQKKIAAAKIKEPKIKKEDKEPKIAQPKAQPQQKQPILNITNQMQQLQALTQVKNKFSNASVIKQDFTLSSGAMQIDSKLQPKLSLLEAASKIIQDNNVLAATLEKIQPKIKTFIKDTERATQNIVNGLEQKIQRLAKSQQKQEDFYTKIDQARLQLEIQEYQQQQIANIENLKQQISYIQLNLDNINNFKTQKIKINIEFVLSALEVQSNIGKYDRLIFNDMVYNIQTNEAMQKFDYKETINGAMGFENNDLILAHDNYGKISHWKWTGSQYEFQRLNISMNSRKEASVSQLKYYPEYFNDLLFAVCKGASVIKIKLDLQDFKKSKSSALYSGKADQMIEYKVISPNIMIALYSQNLVQVDIESTKTLQTYNFAPSVTSSIFLLPNFDLNQFPMVMFQSGTQKMNIVDLNNVGYKGNVVGLENVKLLQKLDLVENVQGNEGYVIGNDENNETKIYKLILN